MIMPETLEEIITRKQNKLHALSPPAKITWQDNWHGLANWFDEYSPFIAAGFFWLAFVGYLIAIIKW